MKKITILCDVDGVLNALFWGKATAVPDTWPDFQKTFVGPFEITYSRKMAEAIASLAPVEWLTTWSMYRDEDKASAEISPLVGWPRLRAHTSEDGSDERPKKMSASRSWWKLDTVLALVKKRPDEYFVWIDDDLSETIKRFDILPPNPYGLEDDVRQALQNVYFICPQPDIGVTPEQIEAAREWIADLQKETP